MVERTPPAVLDQSLKAYQRVRVQFAPVNLPTEEKIINIVDFPISVDKLDNAAALRHTHKYR
jgi:hypothetical protein